MSRPLDLHQPQRQNPFGVAVIFVKNLRIAINIFISVFFVQFGTSFNFFSVSIYSIAGVILVLFLVLSYYQYRRFLFYIEDDKFVLEEGVFRRDKMTIPFDRIQSVNLTQNLIQQILNVTALKVDTAGSKLKEMEIVALDKAYAKKLQKHLLELKHQSLGAEQQEEGATDFSTQTDVKQEPLLRLSVVDVLKVGVTENHLRNGLILFAVINGYIWQFEDYILKPFEGYIDEATDRVFAYGLIVVPISVILFLIIGILFSIVQSFLKYFNLRFFANRKGVSMQSGLLKKAEYNIPVNKIQYIKWSSNPLRKLIGYKTITIKQAGSEEASDRKSLQIPGAKEFQVDTVLDFFFKERKLEAQGAVKAHWLLASQLSFFVSIVPVGALIVGGFWITQLWYVVPVVLLAIIWLCYQYYKTVSLSWNKELIMLSKGYVFPKTYYLKFYKMQNVELRQSFLQKPRGLAHLVFYSAAGNLRLPHIPLEKAEVLYNYILYKVESSNQSWM